MRFEARFFETATGRSQPRDYLDELADDDAAQILADVQACAEYGVPGAPVSWKPIKGCAPLFEIRTHRFRTYCLLKGGVLWVLHVGDKRHQDRDIRSAHGRMLEILRRQR